MPVSTTITLHPINLEVEDGLLQDCFPLRFSISIEGETCWGPNHEHRSGFDHPAWPSQ